MASVVNGGDIVNGKDLKMASTPNGGDIVNGENVHYLIRPASNVVEA